jgi:drug/metabolite transporter (DMT)-like permease
MRWNAGLAALAAAWGLVAVLAGAVSVDAGPLAFLRLALAALTLGAVALFTTGVRRLAPGPHLLKLVALGIVQAAHWWLFFETVKRGSVALAVLTFYTAPIFLAVLAPLFLPERLSNVALGALVPGGIGIALVALAGEDGHAFGWVALACGLGSALTFAVLLVLSKRLLHAQVPPLTVAFWDCLVGTLAISPALLFAGTVLPADAGEWAAVLVLGIGLTGLSTLAYASLLRHTTAQAAGILTFLEPVSAVVLAWALLGQSLSAQALLGGVLVLLAGIAVVALEPAEQPISEAVAAVGSAAEP